MLLQETPPDTSFYMILGYAVFALIMAIYLLSLLLRRRNLEQDLGILQGMQAETQAPEAKAPPRRAQSSRTAAAKAGKRRGAARKVVRKN